MREGSVNALKDILSSWSDQDVNHFAELMHRFNHSIEDYREVRAAARTADAASAQRSGS